MPLRRLLPLALPACLALVLFASAASASPVDFMFGYELTATTGNGMSFTGIFGYDPATNTFLNAAQQWEFSLSNAVPGTTTGDFGTATFQSPGTINQIAWPNANLNYTDYNPSTSGSPSVTYIDITQSAGTGLLGWGSSTINSDLSLEILNLPMSYADAPGVVNFSSFSQWAPGQTENCGTCFVDGLTGTVTLAPNQQIPAPVTTPEPTTWLLLASGLALLLAYDRTRRRSVC
jgi:hypothetical protein